MKSLSLLCAFNISLLFGSIDDHLKPALDKTEPSNVRNIDYIYVINLDQRPEKFQQTYDQLNNWGIQPYRFSAVNGWELTSKDLQEVGVKYEPWMKKNLWGTHYLPASNSLLHEVMHTEGRTYFCEGMPKGSIGIALSHLSVLQDAIESGYNRFWVMEDDIFIPEGQDPHEISDLIDELTSLVGENGWDILFTDPDTKDQDGNYVVCYSYAVKPNVDPSDPDRFAKRTNLSKNLMKVGARYGGYSMIVNRCGAEKILNFIKKYKIFLPFDMEFTLPDDINLYCVRRDIVSTLPQALTDNSYPGYKNKN